MKRRIFFVSITVILILSIIYFLYQFIFIRVDANKNIKDIINDSLVDDYVIFNNKLYYYKISGHLNDVNQLNSVDLSGRNNKNICNNVHLYNFGDGMNFGNLDFVKDNYLYFTSFKGTSSEFASKGYFIHKKINLKTCEISELNNDLKNYEYLNNSISSRYAYMYDENERYTVFVKYDYSKDRIVNKIKVDMCFNPNKLIIDYDNFNVFYVNQNKYVYVNDKKIYSSKNNLHLLTYTNNLLLFYDKDNIYKLDIKNNILVDTIKNPYKNIFRFFSDNNDNYFFADNYIYRYDSKNNKFIKLNYNFDSFEILDKDDEYYDFDSGEEYYDGNIFNINHYDNNIVFDYLDTDGAYNLLIWDIKTNNYLLVKDIVNYIYDGDEIIIIEDEEDFDIRRINTVK